MSSRKRTYSRITRDATELLGKLIRLRRKERKMTENDLAGRAGISRRTLQKIEQGDLKVEVGLFFEVATLVGVNLFGDHPPAISMHLSQINDKLALLPQSVRTPVKVDDEF
ncbi:transcriptional regulator, XRE family [Geoalkalibacter ferrihydriticus]|uniref:XRE family transcriptional regulator n=2 Tax=Geoalkalibacter ferrihydriticus TaxID=392333 RepID=A0A0C2HWP7_9BACT|nr:helix-turn-helix transcriptional regulator [Geoalkalibacter ferrihydriticus]KIH77212.1 XRE family transcriptional regulator [Geoalkalibacter ferrihydriticus DSM 17813]SDM25111.1 transcriptional regulator, XRE family [Geoalkalibacter ferrihydriticus]